MTDPSLLPTACTHVCGDFCGHVENAAFSARARALSVPPPCMLLSALMYCWQQPQFKLETHNLRIDREMLETILASNRERTSVLGERGQMEIHLCQLMWEMSSRYAVCSLQSPPKISLEFKLQERTPLLRWRCQTFTLSGYIAPRDISHEHIVPPCSVGSHSILLQNVESDHQTSRRWSRRCRPSRTSPGGRAKGTQPASEKYVQGMYSKY